MPTQVFKLVLNVEPWSDVEEIERGSDAWVEALGELGSLIDFRIDEVVPDRDTYIEKIVMPSYERFSEFISERYRGKADVKKLVKQAMRYDKWVENRKKVMSKDYGSEFKRRVSSKKDKYKQSTFYTYPWVGYKNYVWGAGTLVTMYASGDRRAVNECEIYTSIYGEVCEGEPEILVDEEYINAFRTAMVNAFAYVGSVILEAIANGIVMPGMESWLTNTVATVFEEYRKPEAYLNIGISITNKIVLTVMGGWL